MLGSVLLSIAVDNVSNEGGRVNPYSKGFLIFCPPLAPKHS
jgi:hypothetical protein